MDVEAVRNRLQQHGQEHLLDYWHELSATQQRHLYDDIKNTDIGEACGYFARTSQNATSVGCSAVKLDERLQPVPDHVTGSAVSSKPELLHYYRQLGMKAVRQSEVGVLLLAGGQGTRLGVNYPKGMYQVGLPSGKSLYQLQAERLLRLQRLAVRQDASVKGDGAENGAGDNGAVVTWYIMTSEATKQPTVEYFRRHDYFGLCPSDVVFFEQGTLPCFSLDGRILLESREKLARAPDGNGGLYRALRHHRITEHMRQRGVRYLHVYCVDNILVKMADPVFMGFCIDRQADCAAKVVEKSSPNEAVGVVCQLDNHYRVVEYSEISETTAQRRNPHDGRLTFNAGSICNHFFTLEFLEHVISEKLSELVHHVAKKKIPFVDSHGNTVKPDKPNGVKMEKFVFDVFQFSKNFAVWEVSRDDEFSPLKNADAVEGASVVKDSPSTARAALCRLHRRLVEAAGGVFVDERHNCLTASATDQGDIVCEISPLLSYDGEDLAALVKDKRFTSPLLLDNNNNNNTSASVNVNVNSNGTC